MQKLLLRTRAQHRIHLSLSNRRSRREGAAGQRVSPDQNERNPVHATRKKQRPRLFKVAYGTAA